MIIENVPNIRDVNILINLLKDLSVEVNQTSDDTYRFKAEKINIDYLASDEYKEKVVQLEDQ